MHLSLLKFLFRIRNLLPHPRSTHNNLKPLSPQTPDTSKFQRKCTKLTADAHMKSCLAPSALQLFDHLCNQAHHLADFAHRNHQYRLREQNSVRTHDCGTSTRVTYPVWCSIAINLPPDECCWKSGSRCERARCTARVFPFLGFFHFVLTSLHSRYICSILIVFIHYIGSLVCRSTLSVCLTSSPRLKRFRRRAAPCVVYFNKCQGHRMRKINNTRWADSIHTFTMFHSIKQRHQNNPGYFIGNNWLGHPLTKRSAWLYNLPKRDWHEPATGGETNAWNVRELVTLREWFCKYKYRYRSSSDMSSVRSPSCSSKLKAPSPAINMIFIRRRCGRRRSRLSPNDGGTDLMTRVTGVLISWWNSSICSWFVKTKPH